MSKRRIKLDKREGQTKTNVVDFCVKKPCKKHTDDRVVTMLEHALKAAKKGHVKNIGIAYVGSDGKMMIASEGSEEYNTALMGGLMSLSLMLGRH